MDWNYFFQQVINGLVLGSMYAMVALGYTMVYGIISLINFAHGEVLMFGCLIAYTVIMALGGEGSALPLPVVLLIATVVACAGAALLNYTIYKMAYQPLLRRNSPRLTMLITAIGMSLLLQALAMMIWKPTYKPYPQLLPSDPIYIGELIINGRQIIILLVTFAIMGGLLWLVNHSKLGRAMRATAENPHVAALMGVKPDQVIAATFVIGAVLAAIAGIMWASNYGTAHHAMGFLPGLKAFTAAVLGGIGNLPGAVVGGIIIGLAETLAGGYLHDLTGGLLGSHYSEIVPFIFLVVMLIFRPSGLLGERVADRA